MRMGGGWGLPVVGVLALLLVVGQLVPALLGLEVDTTRPTIAPVMIWVVFWLVVPFASAFIGDWYTLLNPWRTLGRWFGVGSEEAGHRLAGHRRGRSVAAVGEATGDPLIDEPRDLVAEEAGVRHVDDLVHAAIEEAAYLAPLRPRPPPDRVVGPDPDLEARAPGEAPDRPGQRSTPCRV